MIVEKKFSFFVENHGADGGDGLGHGADSEDGIALHGFGGFAVGHALRLKESDLTMAQNERDGAGDAFVVDTVLDRG